MLEFDMIDVSEGIEVNKIDGLHQCIIAITGNFLR